MARLNTFKVRLTDEEVGKLKYFAVVFVGLYLSRKLVNFDSNFELASGHR
jgi:hypothetical protein